MKCGRDKAARILNSFFFLLDTKCGPFPNMELALANGEGAEVVGGFFFLPFQASLSKPKAILCRLSAPVTLDLQDPKDLASRQRHEGS